MIYSNNFWVNWKDIPLSFRMEHFAHALGWVCLYWGQLEATLNSTLLILLKIDPNSAAGLSLVGNMLFQEKVKAAATVGFANRIDDPWHESLKVLLDNILKLSETRNRYIHDLWHVYSGPTPIKTQFKPQLFMAQSRTPVQLKGKRVTAVTIEEVRSVAKKILMANHNLGQAAVKFAAHHALPYRPW